MSVSETVFLVSEITKPYVYTCLRYKKKNCQELCGRRCGLSHHLVWCCSSKKKGVQFFSHVFVRFEIQKLTTSHWHKHFVPASGIMAHAVQFVFLMWTALQTRFWVDLPMGAQKVIYGKQHMLCRVWHKKRKNANLNFLDPLQCFANPEDCLRLGPAPKNLSWNQKSKKWREFS